jgi:type III secretory pathway lipoprotein EscJ
MLPKKLSGLVKKTITGVDPESISVVKAARKSRAMATGQVRIEVDSVAVGLTMV